MTVKPDTYWRPTILFPKDEEKPVKRCAVELGITAAEFIRRATREKVEREGKK
jgi:hypothetical protein